MKKRTLALVIALMLVVAGSQMTGCRRIRSAAGPAPKAQDVELTVILKGAYLGLEKQFEVGQTVRQKETGNMVGTIASIETSPTQNTVGTAEGKIVLSIVPNQQDIYLTIKGTAEPRDDGYRFDGEAVYVNQEAKLVTPFVQFSGIVLTLEETGK